MTSWHAADLPPIPPAAVSPVRGFDSRRPYPDPYYPEQYERDGSGRYPPPEFDRERDWAEWDRRRNSTRGRSRSPDDGRRKRRRSFSPYERDRYDPRPRYDDDYRRGARSPTYSQRGAGRSFDPMAVDTPVSFRAWTDWLKDNHPEEYATEEAADKDDDKVAEGAGLKARYENYRRTIFCNQIYVMFKYHKGSPWFNERYNPEVPFVNLRYRVRREGWKGRIPKFIQELEDGKYDDTSSPVEKPSNEPAPSSPKPDIDMPPAETTVKAETEGTEESAVKPEADENGDTPMVDSPTKSNGLGNHPDEKKPDEGDAEPAPARLRSDEVSVVPEGNQVLIRTIPPDIGRVRLEKACRDINGFRYLALGDAMQKRNYYRAGWISFDEDADMSYVVNRLSDEKIEGFKLHVSHSTRPFVNRIRYTSEVASKPDRVVKDLTNVRKLATMLEDEAHTLNQLPERLPEPINLKKRDGGEIADEDTVDIPEFESAMKTDEPPLRGSEAVERRLEKLYSELPPKAEEDEDDTAITNKKNEIALDMYLAYVRTAFHCCYYCAAITDHEEELQRKCIKHVRRPYTSATVKDDRWEEQTDSKIALLIDRANVDPREHGGKNYDAEMIKAVEPHIKQEDEGKFRCKTCSKLFKATSFVQKHIASKHGELLESLKEIPFVNNFALDPHKISPFAHAPPPTGNGQQAPPEAFGLRYASRREPERPPYDSRSQGGYSGYSSSYNPRHGSSYDYPPPPRYDDPYGGYPRRGYENASFPPSRKLSDRLGDYVGPPPGDPYYRREPVGLPAKPPASTRMLDSGRRRDDILAGEPLAPPPDAREDPRAAAGRKVSYHDIDRIAEGDVELNY